MTDTPDRTSKILESLSPCIVILCGLVFLVLEVGTILSADAPTMLRLGMAAVVLGFWAHAGVLLSTRWPLSLIGLLLVALAAWAQFTLMENSTFAIVFGAFVLVGIIHTASLWYKRPKPAA